MATLGEAAHLVVDDVVEHVVRRQHEPPVEAERTLLEHEPNGCAGRAVVSCVYETLSAAALDCMISRMRAALPADPAPGELETLEPEAARRDAGELPFEPGQASQIASSMYDSEARGGR